MLKLLSSVAVPALLLLAALPRACERKIGEDENGFPIQPSATSSPPSIPTPAPPISGTPLSAFLPDGGGDDTLTQAKKYEANGQLWLARLLVEPLALADDGKQEEVLLLSRICDKQEDDGCIERCNAKLPRNLQTQVKKRDGGRGISIAPPRPDDNSDFGRAQRLILGGKPKEARAILEPKVIDGKSSPEETRLLREACKAQNDKMCVALCNSKLPAGSQR
jgi:hypothetical protein